MSESGFSPLSEEEYTYCANDPINLVDADGNFIFTSLARLSPVLFRLSMEYIPPSFVAIGGVFDAYDAYTTLKDPCASYRYKGFTVGFYVGSTFIPGDEYVRIGNRFWNKVYFFKGVKVFQRNDLIDPNHVVDGISNLERMKMGECPQLVQMVFQSNCTICCKLQMVH